MAKFENHLVQNQLKQVLVHRKGATRAFPAGREELPEVYRQTGQPVIIPGDTGRASYILVGTELALQETFGSVCHGAGRVMSRTVARKGKQSKDVIEELLNKGVIVRASTREGLTEEVPEAYKSIDQVIGVVHNAGLAQKSLVSSPSGSLRDKKANSDKRSSSGGLPPRKGMRCLRAKAKRLAGFTAGEPTKYVRAV